LNEDLTALYVDILKHKLAAKLIRLEDSIYEVITYINNPDVNEALKRYITNIEDITPSNSYFLYPRGEEDGT
jgi:hypothetical protein